MNRIKKLREDKRKSNVNIWKPWLRINKTWANSCFLRFCKSNKSVKLWWFKADDEEQMFHLMLLKDRNISIKIPAWHMYWIQTQKKTNFKIYYAFCATNYSINRTEKYSFKYIKYILTSILYWGIIRPLKCGIEHAIVMFY